MRSGRRRKSTMTPFDRGDVVVVDFGIAGKARPCVVVSRPEADSRRSMTVVVPMTTEARGGECELAFPKPRWLRYESVLNVLGIAGVENHRIEARLAPFPIESFARLEDLLCRTLGLNPAPSPEPPHTPSVGR